MNPNDFPRNPTTGAMLSELERLGEAVRGRPLKPAQLRDLLRAKGYEIDEPGSTKASEVER